MLCVLVVIEAIIWLSVFGLWPLGFVLQVSLDVSNQYGWKECFSVDGVILPTGYYLGFSAATGDLAGNISDKYLYDIRELTINSVLF